MKMNVKQQTPIVYFLYNTFFLLALSSLASCNVARAIAPTETLAPATPPTATVTPSPVPTSTLTTIPSPTITPFPTIDPTWISFDSEWLQLYYPKDWNVEAPLGAPVCVPGIADCIIRLSHLPSETVEIQFVRKQSMDKSLDVVTTDLRDWDMRKLGATMTGASDYLKLVAVDGIKIDGIKAIRRLYEYPLVDMSTNKMTAIQYTYRVMVIVGEYTYSFEMKTTNADEFSIYTAIADGIVATITFHK